MSLDTLRYTPAPGHFDEVTGLDGQARPVWQGVARALGTLDPATLLERQRQADRLLDAEGTGHLVHDLSLAVGRHGDEAQRSQSHPWRLDPVPYVIDRAEFDLLADAALQRMRVLEAVLADCYGPRTLVAAGVVPGAVLHGLPSFRPAAGGPGAVGQWLTTYALDVARNASGAWHVVADATDAPSGLGYSLLNRTVLTRLLPDGMRAAGAAPIHDIADELRRALAAMAPGDRRSPRTVLLSPGPAGDTYVEHSYLATRLGVHLVEGADLVMREGRLWLRSIDGLEPIDVVHRRLDDARLDPLEPGHVGGGMGVPGLVWGARSGGVVVANAYGTALAEAGAVTEVLDQAATALCGEALRLPLLPHGAALATSPVFDRSDGSVHGRPVVVRLQVVRRGDDHRVMPGGAGRVLAPGDHPAAPTAQIAKDVWVVGGVTARPVRVVAPPQVNFGSSVPKRVADSMYWLGRAAERAEVATRALRVVAQQLEQDPALVVVDDGAWALGARALLRSAQAVPAAPVDGTPVGEWLPAEVAGAAQAAAAQLAALVQEAASVREYLSATTGRVLGRLARAHGALLETSPSPDDLDAVLADLAALAGLAMESTVRGPAWRFLDLGRRLERSLAVVGAIEAALGAATGPMALQPLAEATLSTHESLVAYRRMYRSDVDLAAVLDLLVHDDTNPRSLTFQLDRLREHVIGLGWPGGGRLVEDAAVASLVHVGDSVVGGRRVAVDGLVIAVRGPLLALADAVVQHWFADPVNPTVVRGQ
ncbi:MAG: circularly permuted type 2 ATP-grasp protein [Ilumatobacter sp.]|nr:circularly permuted type 2 ATP-grasp protein [Ilumatobacter sp.]